MLIISEDALGNVLQRLPRVCLDQILTSNRAIYVGISRLSEPSNVGSLRGLFMEVLEPTESGMEVQLMAVDPDDGSWRFDSRVHCRSVEALHAVFQDSVVTHVVFVHVDPGMVVTLLPFACRWKCATVFRHHSSFATLTHFIGYFDQRALTNETQYIDLPPQPQFTVEASRLWSLGVIKRCRRLNITQVPAEALVSAAYVLDWVKDTRRAPAGTKHLEIAENALATDKESFIDAIRSDFETSVDSCPFKIEIRYWTLRRRLAIASEMVNAQTGERLRISDVEWTVTLDRRPSRVS